MREVDPDKEDTREEEPVQQDSLAGNAILTLRERLAGKRRKRLNVICTRYNTHLGLPEHAQENDD